MSIGCKMRSLGESTYFMRFLEPRIKELMGETPYNLDYINGQRKVIIHTDRVDDEKLEAIKNAFTELETNVIIKEEQYNHHIEVSWRDINKYAKCLNQSDMLAINPNFGADLTSDKEWVYPMTSYVGQFDRFFPIGGAFGDQRRHVKILHFNAPVLNKQGLLFHNCGNLKEAYLHVPALRKNNELIRQNNKLEVLHLNAAEGTSFRLLCWGNYVLREVKLYCPAAKDFSGAFNDCRLPSAAVADITNALPTWSDGEEHLLTLGIHVDHKNDEKVLAAISNAEAKGWTLTVQWNGTPTSAASTFNLGTLIYAKTSESELPDGTIEKYLDWGHYVTNEEGYETFRSLESAYEYFGLEILKEETKSN